MGAVDHPDVTEECPDDEEAVPPGGAYLLEVLPEDLLLQIFLCVCSGKSGSHRQGLILGAVNHAVRTIVQTRLWHALCDATADLRMCVSHLDHAASAAQDDDAYWRALHRTLTVPVRLRSRCWRSWVIDARLKRSHSNGKAALLHLDTRAPSRLTPGYGFSAWSGADHLLKESARRMLASEAGAALGASASDSAASAAGAASNVGSVVAPSTVLGACGGTASSTQLQEVSDLAAGSGVPSLLCILRESSPDHLLIAGILPRLPRAALRQLGAFEAGVTPAISYRDAVATARQPADRSPPPQRCLCCASQLRRVVRHSGAVCAPARRMPKVERPPVMREASAWFRHDIDMWHSRVGCADATAIAAAEADAACEASSTVGRWGRGRQPESKTRYACLESALVCPRGHVLLTYELYEVEGASDDESEVGSEEALSAWGSEADSADDLSGDDVADSDDDDDDDSDDDDDDDEEGGEDSEADTEEEEARAEDGADGEEEEYNSEEDGSGIGWLSDSQSDSQSDSSARQPRSQLGWRGALRVSRVSQATLKTPVHAAFEY